MILLYALASPCTLLPHYLLASSLSLPVASLAPSRGRAWELLVPLTLLPSFAPLLLPLTLFPFANLDRPPLELEEISSPHVRPKALGDDDARLGLVILQDGAYTPPRCAERRVEEVAVASRSLALLFDPVSRAHRPALVVRAIRAADKLPVRVLAGEPALEIVLLDGGVVEFAGDEANNAVRNAQGLIEFLRGLFWEGGEGEGGDEGNEGNEVNDGKESGVWWPNPRD